VSADAAVGEPRAGRPRDPALDDAILEAALAEFAEAGFAGVTIEGVAARAGVGKATVYRRYADKVALVVAALGRGAHVGDELPDTGDVHADLRAMLLPLFDRLRGPDARLLLAFAADRVRHPELGAEFDRVVVGRKREHIHRLLQAAVERGQLPPDADLDLIAEAGPAILWHRAHYGLGFPDDLPDRIVRQLLGPAGPV